MKDLVKIIQENPGCTAIIDNDYWSLHKIDPYGPDVPNKEDMSDEQFEAWNSENTLIKSYDKFKPLGDGGYGSGNCYGGDILQALAKIVGIKIQSV